MNSEHITRNPDIAERAFHMVLVLMHRVLHMLQKLLGNIAPVKIIVQIRCHQVAYLKIVIPYEDFRLLNFDGVFMNT